MPKRDPDQQRFSQINDSVVAVIDSIAKLMAGAGGLAALGGIGLLIFTFFAAGGADQAALENAGRFLEAYRAAALYGTLVACLGLAWLTFGEETSGPVMIILGCGLIFCPAYFPLLVGGNVSAPMQNDVMQYLSIAGWPATLIGLFVIVADVLGRARQRAKQGARADSLKYGKGLKEEKDVRNVFLGKCWQLPYCRKFVRERCPIYHSKRTCWKERVGCMCEESVIQNALEGKVIPSDIVAAAKYIPQNNRLTPQQKAERCRMCVIYNEHQKHQYKLSLPVTMGVFVVLYALFREPLAKSIQTGLLKMDSVWSVVTLQGANGQAEPATATDVVGGVIPYHEIILVVLFMVAMAYAIKVIEAIIFRRRA